MIYCHEKLFLRKGDSAKSYRVETKIFISNEFFLGSFNQKILKLWHFFAYIWIQKLIQNATDKFKTGKKEKVENELCSISYF